ncbi:MAG: protein-disulfide reductase DsbD domain-containing protein [Terriglobales bacterium]
MPRLALALILFLAALPAVAQSTLAAPHVKVSLISENASLQPGKTAWVGLRFQLEKGWHVYWKNPGDSGEPPKIDWQLPAGWKAGDLQYPLPHRLPLQTLMNFGYENDVLYLVPLTVPAAAKGPASLVANIRWMVCENTCIPGKGKLTVSLPVASTAPQPGVQAQLIKDARARLPRNGGLRATISSSNDSFVFRVTAPAKGAEFFPFDDLQIENAAPQRFTGGAGSFQLAVKKSEQLAKLPLRIRGLLVLDGRRGYEVDLPVRPGTPPAKRPAK